MRGRALQAGMALLLMACSALCMRPAQALDPAKMPTQYVHTVWRTEDGLPQSAVTKIIETRDGYLWVGTQGGIARFDGVRFTSFDHTNTPELRDDFVADLAEDAGGTLWIATASGGVTSYRDGTFTHIDSIGPRAGSTVAATGDGSVWVGGHGGLVHLRGGAVQRIYTTSDGLFTDLVRRLVPDGGGGLWIATSGGLNHMAGGRLTQRAGRGEAAADDVSDLFVDQGKTLWVRTRDGRIERRVGDRVEPWEAAGFPTRNVTDMLVDRDDNLWMASGDFGLLRVAAGKVSRFSTKDGLSSDQVSTLFQDHSGNLWVGTIGGGLDRFRDGAFTTFATEDGLAADQVRSMLQDRQGDVWIATGAGLNRLHDNGIETITKADGLPSNEVLSLEEDAAGDVWVGVSGDLVRFHKGRIAQTLGKADGLSGYQITGIHADAHRHLWLSTRGGGVQRFGADGTMPFTKAQGLLDDFVYALAEGTDGTLWAGSSYGVSRIRDGRIATDATAGQLGDMLVLSLFDDGARGLWIGTNGRGLYRLKGGALQQFTTHQGLPDDSVNNLLDDSAGNLWVGSNKGVFRIARSDLEAVARGERAQLSPLLFGKADGLESIETTAGSQPSGWRGRDGRLWFPTIRGVSVIDPARLGIDPTPPRPRIEQLLADEAPLDTRHALALAPGTLRLEIHYTAPELSAPERTRFRYRMDGLETQWTAGNPERMAQYTNLSPGHYTFRVSAAGADGRWSATEATLPLYVQPRFYQTWWFRTLVGLLVLLLGWMAYRLRVNWLYAKAGILEERQRIAGEIHDSLAQGLSGIVFQTEAALISMGRAPHMTATHLTSARDLAKTSLDDARYSVWNLSPPNLTHKSMVESLRAMAEQITAGRVDAMHVRSTGVEWSIRPDAQHHIVLITQEAISNAIQHGNARQLTIDVTYSPSAMHLVISDDGTGFPPVMNAQLPARGYGMHNIRRRSDRLDARLEVTSEPGHGARVSLRMPRPNLLRRLWRSLHGRNLDRIEG